MILETTSLCGELVKSHRFIVILETTSLCDELIKLHGVKVRCDL